MDGEVPIRLTKSQEIAIIKFKECQDRFKGLLENERAQLRNYLTLCLKEAGVEDATGWSFDEAAMEWRKPEDE
jgi:hypothetical protein